MDADEHEGSCCFDDWATHNAKRARKLGISAAITRQLLAALEQQGLEGRSILDVGCGTGDLALAALQRGAVSARGIDLGSVAIEEARALAAERSLADRATFTVGDGSAEPLERHDIVTLNRVLCCYPRVEQLLENSLEATGTMYAYSAPVHTGLVGVLNRVKIAIGNSWFRLRDRKFQGFRAFVHDLDRVDRRIGEAGFHRVHGSRHHLAWQLSVFTRA
jgi:SAM-dependent methyltransferase